MRELVATQVQPISSWTVLPRNNLKFPLYAFVERQAEAFGTMTAPTALTTLGRLSSRTPWEISFAQPMSAVKNAAGCQRTILAEVQWESE
jgi:hypothetical protein